MSNPVPRIDDVVASDGPTEQRLAAVVLGHRFASLGE
jgi:hypothetical protein